MWHPKCNILNTILLEGSIRLKQGEQYHLCWTAVWIKCSCLKQRILQVPHYLGLFFFFFLKVYQIIKHIYWEKKKKKERRNVSKLIQKVILHLGGNSKTNSIAPLQLLKSEYIILKLKVLLPVYKDFAGFTCMWRTFLHGMKTYLKHNKKVTLCGEVNRRTKC